MTITSEEAKEIALAVGTAMAENDKAAREMMYKDLSEEDLKKVLRWTTRWLINHVLILCTINGILFEQGWRHFALGIALQNLEGETNDS